MAYMIHGVELGQNEPPPLNPTGASADFSSTIQQFVPLVTGAAQGLATGVLQQFAPRPAPLPQPKKTDWTDYLLPVAALAVLVGGGVMLARRQGGAR